MPEITTTQVVFERFLRGELSQDQAVDAMVSILQSQKTTNGAETALSLKKPIGVVLSATDQTRAEALLIALDKRVSAA